MWPPGVFATGDAFERQTDLTANVGSSPFVVAGEDLKLDAETA